MGSAPGWVAVWAEARLQDHILGLETEGASSLGLDLRTGMLCHQRPFFHRGAHSRVLGRPRGLSWDKGREVPGHPVGSRPELCVQLLPQCLPGDGPMRSLSLSFFNKVNSPALPIHIVGRPLAPAFQSKTTYVSQGGPGCGCSCFA